MWTTLNFLANQLRLKRVFAILTFAVVLACSLYLTSGLAAPQDVAPDAPRPARPTKASSTGGRYSLPKPLEIRSVRVARVDQRTAKLAGDEFMRKATQPLVIEVRTVQPLGDLTRTSSPVIVLNGEVLSETIPLVPNRLVAFLPDRRTLKETNSVTLVRLGQEDLTRSRRTVTFTSRSIR